MFYLLIAITIITSFAFEALMLYITTKLFKIKNATYKTSLTISIYQWISVIILSIVNSIIFYSIAIEDIGTAFSIILSIYIFHKLLENYYQTKLKKNIAIYLVFTTISIVVTLTIVLLTIIPIRSFIAAPFSIEGGSMEPTYQTGEVVVINKFAKEFKKGEVVIYRNPQDPQQFYVSRLVGLPNELVQVNENQIQLKENEFYVLGDNKDKSLDSRNFGPIQIDSIIGKVWFKIEALKTK